MNQQDETQKADQNIYVAYADDHTAVRKGIIAFLHSLGGIDVFIEADNGNELIGKIYKSPIIPDVCILDIKMPEMDGFETLNLLRSKWPKIKVLILTTFVDELYIIRMVQLGANGYLAKSCDPEEIKKALIAIHEEGFYFSRLFSPRINSEPEAKLPRITEREFRLLKYICEDLTYGQIASLMNTTQRSVEGYRDSLFRKLNVNNRVSLALFAIKAGIVPIEGGQNPMPKK